jgi:hypothetical protein
MRFSVANKDSAVLDFDDSRIGEGDSEDVRSKVLETCFARTYGLGIDVPIDLPDLRGDLAEEAGLFHFITELSFEDDRESSDGKIEVDP